MKVEPNGYHALINHTTHEIKLKFEPELQDFSGELDSLPSFTEDPAPLLAPEQALMQEEAALEPISKGQK